MPGGQPDAAGPFGHQPFAPQSAPTQPAQQPVHGGWTGAWQDEHGQWHYPYSTYAPTAPFPPATPVMQPMQAPQPMQPTSAYAPVQPARTAPAPEMSVHPTFVTPDQLEPVGPPMYFAPVAPARDARQRTMAAVIVFVALIIGLWAILGFMGAMADTLASVSSGTIKIRTQLATANEGLAGLESKTGDLPGMADDTAAMKTELEGIDGNLGAMLTGVDRIGAGMKSMDGSLTELNSSLAQVNEINGGMAADLASINAGLGTQKSNVGRMRADVVGTANVLKTVPTALKRTNGRLTHVNSVMNYMGCAGILNNLQVKIFLGPISNGSAKVVATIVPPGAWGTKADGTPCG